MPSVILDCLFCKYFKMNPSCRYNFCCAKGIKVAEEAAQQGQCNFFEKEEVVETPQDTIELVERNSKSFFAMLIVD